MKTNKQTMNITQRLSKPYFNMLMNACLIPVILTGCQTIAQPVIAVPTVNNKTTVLTPHKLTSFNIAGKLGMTNPTANQAGSVFYVWMQQNDNFTIELQGPFGIGFTSIKYDGNIATLENNTVGKMSASSPNELLMQATGWQAPIEQLAYWISGSPAPTDDSQLLDNNNRLIEATNAQWKINLIYASSETLPEKVIARHDNGNKVVLTIKHK